MVAVGVTAENQLPLLAFVLVEGENNESWKWFLGLVRKQVLGPNKQVCIILYPHCGLLNRAKEHLEVVFMSFFHKHLEEAMEQGGYRQVEGVVQG
jgi:hypothetical protein